MNGKRRFAWGHVAIILLGLAGVWLLLAPRWVGFQAGHTMAHVDQGVGGVLILVSGVTLFLQWAFGLAEFVGAHSKAHLPETLRQDMAEL